MKTIAEMNLQELAAFVGQPHCDCCKKSYNCC